MATRGIGPWLIGTICLAGVLSLGVHWATRSSRPADTPEEAIEFFLDATRSDDRIALAKVWWIGDDPDLQQRVIATYCTSNAASRRFHDHLRRAYADELQQLASAGRIGLPEARDVPTAADIAKAVGEALKRDGRLVVFLRGTDILYVAQHGEHWYVEHDFVAVDRDWKEKDFQVLVATADLYERLDARIGQPGQSAWGLLQEQQRGLQAVAAEYGAPLLIR
ncbi:MAG: hypothetical protein IPM29_23835 [Planctomycetes bacterium]|nr:hypothetical protein [Planctomycetota bacterium]